MSIDHTDKTSSVFYISMPLLGIPELCRGAQERSYYSWPALALHRF
jgi:hypothetical protein